MRLYLIRHGETDHNVARRIQGPLLDDSLNERGRQQAQALGDHFAEAREKGLRLDAVYASPMKRAHETAEQVARGAGAPEVRTLEALIEFSWGIYLGREEHEVREPMKEAHRHWQDGNVHHTLPEGESPWSAWERARTGIHPVLERHRHENIAMVAHGRINKIILSSLLHRDLTRMEEFPQGNTSVTLLECDPENVPEGPWRVVYVNRKDHLEGLPEGVPDAQAGQGDAPMV